MRTRHPATRIVLKRIREKLENDTWTINHLLDWRILLFRIIPNKIPQNSEIETIPLKDFLFTDYGFLENLERSSNNSDYHIKKIKKEELWWEMCLYIARNIKLRDREEHCM